MRKSRSNNVRFNQLPDINDELDKKEDPPHSV